MSDSEKAAKVMEALKAAEREPAQIALPILNGIVGLVQGDHEQRLEVEEARSSAFLAICEVGKALHRGQPADGLWAAAISATERWMALARGSYLYRQVMSALARIADSSWTSRQVRLVPKSDIDLIMI